MFRIKTNASKLSGRTHWVTPFWPTSILNIICHNKSINVKTRYLSILIKFKGCNYILRNLFFFLSLKILTHQISSTNIIVCTNVAISIPSNICTIWQVSDITRKIYTIPYIIVGDCGDRFAMNFTDVQGLKNTYTKFKMFASLINMLMEARRMLSFLIS